MYSQRSGCRLRDYQYEDWARKFYENWKASLKWQRRKPNKTFAGMIARHRDGMAVSCISENKVLPRFAAGLNKHLPVIQRRAYDLRDDEYQRRNAPTCLPPEP